MEMMDHRNYSGNMYNLFVKHLDGKTLTLIFPSPILFAKTIKDRLFDLTGIPPHHQRLVTGFRHLNDEGSAICSPDGSNIFPTVRLLLRLKGGKGGFGSLLRGAATKAGQKKTNNFDACRDMSGRRLRHVNAEKRLEEWKAAEEERRLEKVAEEFLKKQMKKGKKGAGDGEAHKYVAKYREESERCVAEVAESVKEALKSLNGKRKGSEAALEKADSKKLKIWMGKRKLNESDSDDSDESDDEGGNQKSIVLNSQTESDTNKAEGSSDSVSCKKQSGDSSGAGSCESGSEEERETVLEGKVEAVGSPSGEATQAKLIDDVEPVVYEEMIGAATMPCSESITVISVEDNGHQDCNGAVGQASDNLSSENGADASKSNDMEIDESLQHKALVHEEISPSTSIPALEEPLNFEAFNSAAELEVLGFERLKSELQSRGLKCGGTLQERAARLFLLKSTPLEKIPKKLLAKK
ncbi:hypothetical protein HN51_014461 [Arachis hypogaea]|uniref:Ubiquitin-like domain-containing protein n=1 Tax=Arachis hypogaea TaxID=3818 RepID=A0A445CPI7_ARAHY|nr:replication stress response regulator SDE2 [Arachis hypogaea]QHO45664.1 uncharacterized protein DS421_6g180890 [Arachis hypogaea]RYR52793.1 hypothetical protein Ahy_A06g027663 [Arachis hypogaea]